MISRNFCFIFIFKDYIYQKKNRTR